MKNVKPTDPPVDPTLPVIELAIGGITYYLLFDFLALGIAERKLREAGEWKNMLVAMDIRRLGAERLPLVFFASLVRLQPEITFAEARDLIRMENFPAVYGKVVEAYLEACVPRKKGEKKKEEEPIAEPELEPEAAATGPPSGPLPASTSD